MSKFRRLLPIAILAVVTVFAGCKGEEKYDAPEAFSFVVYPGARYLGQLTEVTKQAHRVLDPGHEPPPTAIYDTDAPVEKVAEYYAKEYGYNGVAAEKPASNETAYYRTGDLATDNKAIEGLLPRLGLKTDVSKAQGTYKAAEIAPRPNRPRVTVSRPYFDVTTSQVVDRTMILMSR